MIIKEITQLGDPVLKTKTRDVPISEIRSTRISSIIADLVDTMRANELVGIAAPQIGQSVRIFVTEVRKTKFRNPDQPDPLRVYINPRIIWFSDEQVEIYEACGSVANVKLFGPVTRPKQLKVASYDQIGNTFSVDADNLLARVIWHEIDHLNGIEFVEKVTDNSRFMTDSEYQKRILKTKT